MSDEPQDPIELSDDELDEVAGGFSVLFSATYFEQSDRLIINNTRSRGRSSFKNSTIASRRIRTFAIQGLFVGNDPSEFRKFLLGE